MRSQDSNEYSFIIANKPDHFSHAKVMHNELNNVLVTSISTPGFELAVKVENLFWEGLEAAIKGYHDAAIVKACDIKITLLESTDQDLMNKYYFRDLGRGPAFGSSGYGQIR